jgi:hypothetical protein
VISPRDRRSSARPSTSEERPSGPPRTNATWLRPETPSEASFCASDLLRGERFALLAVEGHHVCAGGEALEQALAFGGEHLLLGAAVHVFFRDLDHLDGEVAPEAVQVVLAAFGGPALQPPDSHDGGAPYHSISKSCRASPS